MSAFDDYMEHLNGQKNNRITQAAYLLLRWGAIDGAHHKQWTIDQALRVLLDKAYDNVIKMYEEPDPDDPDEYYEWDTGIAP